MIAACPFSFLLFFDPLCLLLLLSMLLLPPLQGVNCTNKQQVAAGKAKSNSRKSALIKSCLMFAQTLQAEKERERGCNSWLMDNPLLDSNSFMNSHKNQAIFTYLNAQKTAKKYAKKQRQASSSCGAVASCNTWKLANTQQAQGRQWHVAVATLTINLERQRKSWEKRNRNRILAN